MRHLAGMTVSASQCRGGAVVTLQLNDVQYVWVESGSSEVTSGDR